MGHPQGALEGRTLAQPSHVRYSPYVLGGMVGGCLERGSAAAFVSFGVPA